MNTKGCSITLIDCGAVGWLGKLELPTGQELYRTGKHHPTPEIALERVKAWTAENEDPNDGLKCCPNCGSGDVRFEEISCRPYCNDCHQLGSINITGRKQDAIDKWNAESEAAHGR